MDEPANRMGWWCPFHLHSGLTRPVFNPPTTRAKLLQCFAAFVPSFLRQSFPAQHFPSRTFLENLCHHMFFPYKFSQSASPAEDTTSMNPSLWSSLRLWPRWYLGSWPRCVWAPTRWFIDVFATILGWFIAQWWCFGDNFSCFIYRFTTKNHLLYLFIDWF